MTTVAIRPHTHQDWQPLLVAVVIVGQCVIGGSNDAFLAALAAAINLACAAAILFASAWPRRSIVMGSPVFASIGLVLAWCLVSVLSSKSTDPDLAALEFGKALAVAGVFLAGAAMGLKPGQRRPCILWIVILGGVSILAMLALQRGGVSEIWGLSLRESQRNRFNAGIGNPNAAGVLFGMLSVLAAGIALDEWRSRPILLQSRHLLKIGISGLAVFSGMVLVALTQSRSAFLCASAALMLLLFAAGGLRSTRDKRIAHMPMPLIAVSIIGALLILLGADAIFERFADIDASSAGRLMLWHYYSGLSLHAPLFGYGLGSFVSLNQHLLTPTTAPALWSFGAAHNAALQFAIEAGAGALLLMAVTLGLVLFRIVRSIRESDTDPIGLSMVLAFGIAGSAAMVDIAWNVPGIVNLSALLLGLCWGRAIGTSPSPQRVSAAAAMRS